MTIADLDPAAADPHLWLEEWHGADALAWVESENARTRERLGGHSLYDELHGQALAIAGAPDRLILPHRVMGRIYNFWRDEARPQGIWRWTTPDSFAQPEPDWHIALDLDALAAQEGTDWVWAGVAVNPDDETRCLVVLSDGGSDANVWREFDLVEQMFVPGGFFLPEGKQQASWLGRDSLLVSRDWDGQSLTRSGYPFVVRRWDRGTALDQAYEIARGDAEDGLGTYAKVLRDPAGGRAVIIERRRAFFAGQSWLWDDRRGLITLDLPPRVFVQAVRDGHLILDVDEDWSGIPAGALASMPLALAREGRLEPSPMFVPGPRQSNNGMILTRHTAMVFYTDTVRSRAKVLRWQEGVWIEQPLTLPDNAHIAPASYSQHDDLVHIVASGFLDPTKLMALELGDSIPEAAVIKAAPPRFSAEGLVVRQHQARSADGTLIPYFLVGRADAPRDGSVPTLITAYGGFQIPMLPAYNSVIGKLWLERGGQYVVANIRGGGEFGPAWHDVGRKTGRQRIYDDFYAVAEDLIVRGVTSPTRLGIFGGSNGGLLMGVALTQRPELWSAVAIQVPLLDMLRYEQIAAGASWRDEFGSVDVPEERAFLASISPYHQLRTGQAYPEPLVWTSTGDDRVGPQHARKFAARMAALDLPYLFYEDTAGGHGGDATVAQVARLRAMEMVYFHHHLGL